MWGWGGGPCCIVLGVELLVALCATAHVQQQEAVVEVGRQAAGLWSRWAVGCKPQRSESEGRGGDEEVCFGASDLEGGGGMGGHWHYVCETLVHCGSGACVFETLIRSPKTR